MYLYTNPQTGEEYAAKMFRTKFNIASPGPEIEILPTLEHQNIVCYKGTHSCISGYRPILLIELMTTNLSDHIIKRKDYAADENLRIAHDIFCGLDYLHTRRPVIIHRDIKAENVLLNELGVAKIGDFGNSRFYDDEQLSTMTACGGTMFYMAPEVMRGRYNEKIDIFSCGHLLLFLFINKFPNKLANSDTEVGKRKVYIDELKKICEEMKLPAIVDTVKECLSDASENRPKSSELCRCFGTLRK